MDLPAGLALAGSRRCLPSRCTSAVGVHRMRLRDQAGPA